MRVVEIGWRERKMDDRNCIISRHVHWVVIHPDDLDII
jgi:hypothetical protein